MLHIQMPFPTVRSIRSRAGLEDTAQHRNLGVASSSKNPCTGTRKITKGMSTGRRLSRPSTTGGKHGRVQTSGRSHKAVTVHEERRLDTILVYLRSPGHEVKQRLEEVHAIIGARKMRGVWSSCPGDDEVKRQLTPLASATKAL